MKREVYVISVTDAAHAPDRIQMCLNSIKNLIAVESVSSYMTGHQVGNISNPNGQPKIETRLNFLLVCAVGTAANDGVVSNGNADMFAAP